MIVEIGSGKSGLKDYFENGKKQGRELHRDQLDQRIPLAGDLAVFEKVTVALANEGVAYDHITLSFSENHVSDEMLQKAVDEFREHALAAWSDEDRDRVPFYAEAHRPKILSYINSQTGEEVTRCTHIHVAIGRHDLLTGKAIEVLGFLGTRTNNIKYVDAFQESFNARHGFSSPKDNPKITPENAIDTLARYTGQIPDQFGTINQQKSALEVILQKEIVAQNVTTWPDFEKILKNYGEVSSIKKGHFNEYFRVKPPGHKQAMRLTGIFFQRQFIERPTQDKITIISQKAKVAYLEQMQPRKEPKYIAGVLDEWHSFRARENRYLHTSSKFYNEVYQPADIQTRLQILNNLERNNHGLTSNPARRSKQIATARNRLPGLPVRDLDAIQKRSEMLLRSDSGIHVRDESSGREKHSGMRQTDGSEGRAARVGQPSSVIQQMESDLLESYEKASSKERFSEIRKNIDCHQLLKKLSHTQKINPALYQVTVAKDGTPRIQCGSRALTPNDFLSKELGLPWREAAQILKVVYENQINHKLINQRSRSSASPLWNQFSVQYKEQSSVLFANRKAFNLETRELNKAITARLKAQKQAALTGLSGASKQDEIKRHASLAVQERVVFDSEREALLEQLRPLPKDQAWSMFLRDRAQQGDESALVELRKIDDGARVVPQTSITGTIELVDDEDEKKRRKRIRESASTIFKQFNVNLNGDVTYHQNGQAVLRDEGNHLAVLDQNNEDVLAAALMLAKERFGMNLTLTGSPEFQARLVKIAVAQNINVRFLDPNLEALRLAEIAKRRPAPHVQPLSAPLVLEENSAPVPVVEDHFETEQESNAASDLIAQFKPVREATKEEAKHALVVGVVEGMAILSVTTNDAQRNRIKINVTYPLLSGQPVQLGKSLTESAAAQNNDRGIGD
jgi:hypothetical protein